MSILNDPDLYNKEDAQITKLFTDDSFQKKLSYLAVSCLIQKTIASLAVVSVDSSYDQVNKKETLVFKDVSDVTLATIEISYNGFNWIAEKI